MRLVRVALFLAPICATLSPASADDLPSRKPGLWEIKMNIEGRGAPQVIQQCIDAATDQMMQQSAGPFSAAACAKRDVQKSAESTTIDSSCTVGGKAATAHATITGSFDSAYTMTVTSHSDALPGNMSNMTMAINGKWLGPCTADQKPGDMIFSNGKKINLLDAMKHVVSPNAPLVPQ